MAFKVRTRSLNHSPQWYDDHCHAEDGGSPAFRSMLKSDMKFLDADWDETLTYEERVGNYEQEWDSVLKGRGGNADPTDLMEVLEREGQLGYRPTELYAKPPFSLIGKLMERHGLSTTDVGTFIRWKAKNDNVKKARDAKKKGSKNVDQSEKGRQFFKSLRPKRTLGEL